MLKNYHLTLLLRKISKSTLIIKIKSKKKKEIRITRIKKKEIKKKIDLMKIDINQSINMKIDTKLYEVESCKETHKEEYEKIQKDSMKTVKQGKIEKESRMPMSKM